MRFARCGDPFFFPQPLGKGIEDSGLRATGLFKGNVIEVILIVPAAQANTTREEEKKSVDFFFFFSITPSFYINNTHTFIHHV